MLNIFRLANILKKIQQINVDKYDLLIYHIRKRATAQQLLADNKNNIILPISMIRTSLSASSLFYPFHQELYQKALFSLSTTTTNTCDLIICQILPAAALLTNTSSTTNLLGTDYIFELNNNDYHQQQPQQQQYNKYNIKNISHHHHQQNTEKDSQGNTKYFCNQKNLFSRLLNFKESSSYIIKYYIINNNSFNKLNKYIIKRKMSTIATTTPENSTQQQQTAVENGGDGDIIKNDTNNISEKIINNSSDEIITATTNLNNGGLTTNGETASGTVKNCNIDENDKSCFTSSLSDIIQFLELVGGLKHTKRTGWVLRDIKDCESISGHMYRMSMMTFLLNGSEGLNQIRCMELALVHDLAESIVGDLTPFCGVSKEDKKKREMDAMENICNLIQPRGERMWKLFQEYEAAETPESKFVKDLDRLDLVLQAFEYEKRDNCVMKHQEFFDSNDGKYDHPFVKKLVNEINEQRKELAEKMNATTEMYEQKQLNGHSSGGGGECPEDLSQKKLTTTS